MDGIRRLILVLAFATLAFAALALAPGTLQAQSWPTRTVRVIVPLPPGTAVDVSARIFTERLSAQWRQPIVVENLPGADGIIAVREFVSRRDDHTLLYSFAGPISINPVLYEKLPYDPDRDLVPIAMSSDNFLALAVSKRLPVGSMESFLTLLRSRPSQLNWASTAGLPYFAFAGLLKGAGLDAVYVPYRDFNAALSDVAEGRIEVVSTALTQMLPHQNAGKLKFLAVFNRTRAPLAPDVPTIAELGFPDFTFEGVTGFFGWRDMPADLRDRIAADIRAVGEDAAVRDRLPPIGIVARLSTASEFAAAIQEQRGKVSAIAKAIGTKPIQ